MSLSALMRSKRVSSGMKEDSDSRSDSVVCQSPSWRVESIQDPGLEYDPVRVVRRTGVCVPFVFVMGALLFAHELLVHDFFELDHFGGGVCGEVSRLLRVIARQERWGCAVWC